MSITSILLCTCVCVSTMYEHIGLNVGAASAQKYS